MCVHVKEGTLETLDVFLIVSGQQWSSVALRNKIYQTLIHRQYLFIGSVRCWFWSFCGIVDNKKNIEYCHLNVVFSSSKSAVLQFSIQ